MPDYVREVYTRNSTSARAVLEFNLGPYNKRVPVYTARYDTLGELLDIIKAFNDVAVIGSSITSVKVQVQRNILGAPQWRTLEFSDWCDLQ